MRVLKWLMLAVMLVPASVGAARAIKRQAVDFALPAVAMAEDADLEFARQVGIFRLRRKELVGFDEQRGRVNDFIGFQAGQRRRNDVASAAGSESPEAFG